MNLIQKVEAFKIQLRKTKHLKHIASRRQQFIKQNYTNQVSDDFLKQLSIQMLRLNNFQSLVNIDENLARDFLSVNYQQKLYQYLERNICIKNYVEVLEHYQYQYIEDMLSQNDVLVLRVVLVMLINCQYANLKQEIFYSRFFMDLVINFTAVMTQKNDQNQIYFLLLDLITNLAITYSEKEKSSCLIYLSQELKKFILPQLYISQSCIKNIDLDSLQSLTWFYRILVSTLFIDINKINISVVDLINSNRLIGESEYQILIIIKSLLRHNKNDRQFYMNLFFPKLSNYIYQTLFSTNDQDNQLECLKILKEVYDNQDEKIDAKFHEDFYKNQQQFLQFASKCVNIDYYDLQVLLIILINVGVQSSQEFTVLFFQNENFFNYVIFCIKNQNKESPEALRLLSDFLHEVPLEIIRYNMQLFKDIFYEILDVFQDQENIRINNVKICSVIQEFFLIDQKMNIKVFKNIAQQDRDLYDYYLSQKKLLNQYQ